MKVQISETFMCLKLLNHSYFHYFISPLLILPNAMEFFFLVLHQRYYCAAFSCTCINELHRKKATLLFSDLSPLLIITKLCVIKYYV